MIDLTNKIAVVTGAGSGIGKAVSEQLATQGAHLILLDNNLDNVQQTVNEILDNKGKASYFHADVTNYNNVHEIISQHATIDILVNCAGISHIGNVLNTTEVDFEKVFDVNVKGIFNCIKAVLPIMQQKKSGVIINISSIAAKVGLQDRFAYSMSKGAVHAMTLSVAKDFLKDNIRCNSISPARIHTPFVDGFLQKNYPGKEKEMFEKLSASQPIGRMGKPEEVAYQVAYLCSEEASFITGSDFAIDGGFVTLNN
jgi:NAD(P)-dependent dehydrogenase (short-subunit alcohol dehydrogenase family)